MFYAAPCQQYQSSGHRDHITDHIATTRGYTETTRVPVKTGQCHPRTTVAAPILLQASANPCKTLQSASICFETAMQENAIFCNRMLRNASFCFAHTCASRPANRKYAGLFGVNVGPLCWRRGTYPRSASNIDCGSNSVNSSGQSRLS